MALDAEDFVIPGHRPDGHREAGEFRYQHFVIAARFALGHPQSVAHQVAGNQHEGRAPALHLLTKTAEARQTFGAQMGVGGVDEGEIRCHRAALKRKVDALLTLVSQRPPEAGRRSPAIRQADEDDLGGRRRLEPILAVWGSGHDRSLVGDANPGQAAFAGVAQAIGVSIFKDRAAHEAEPHLLRSARRAAMRPGKNQKEEEEYPMPADACGVHGDSRFRTR